MSKTRKLNCNKKFTMTILSSFFACSSFLSHNVYADDFNFDANGNIVSFNSSDASSTQVFGATSVNNSQPNFTDTSANTSSTPNQSLSTNSAPSAQIGQLPIAPQEVRANASKAAFDKAVAKKGGLTPDMIRELKRNYEDKERAINENAYDDAIPESRTIPVSLGVSSQKEIIRTSVGYSTSISVVDSTGKPWNVVNTNLGNKKAYSLQRLDGEEGSLFSVTANDSNKRSNLILVLKEGQGSDRKIPIVLDLVSGQRKVDDKLVIRVQAIGPNGSIEQTRLSQGIDSKYIAWLDGVLPSNIKKLKSDDKFLKAWRDSDGSIVVITKYLVYSPISNVMLSSSDGEATLYKLSSRSSVLRARDPITKEEKTIHITGF